MAVKASTSAVNLISPINNTGFQEFIMINAPKYKKPYDLQRLSLKKGNLPEVYQIINYGNIKRSQAGCLDRC